MLDKLHELYENYLLECEPEICSTRRPMSFEEFCEFYGIDEHTSDERLYDIFCA